MTRSCPAGPVPDLVEMFSRRLEGDIDGGACAEMQAHLKTCASCRGRSASLRETLAPCRRSGSQPVPPHVGGAAV